MIEDLWYKNAVIYALNLDSFMDGNGDGVGDFEGLTRRLDYLESLGIDAVWLGPFQPTPNRDHGYDISDFYGVDRRFGSSGDFVEFMQRANSKGIRVLMDLVVNHTSDRHPWFQDARSDPESQHRDWYVWSKKRPKNWKQGMVFPGVQKSTWTRDPEAGLYYYHRFYDFQPDLNMDNDEVRTEVRRIMGYWLQLGVSGFRVDAVPFVIEGLARRDIEKTTAALRRRSCPRRRSGHTFFATTTSSISAVSPTSSARRCSSGSGPSRRCSSMTEAFVAVSRRCLASAPTSSSRTA